MLVGERMSAPVISLSPDTPITEALNLMKQKKIRRAPVIKNGRLLGIVSEKDLLNASPSQATSLSVWELNYLLSKIKVKDVMTARVLTVTEDTPVEEAAHIMIDNKIGGLPVVRGSEVVGIITETDLFKLLTELMGARYEGVRVAALIPNTKGRLAELTRVIANAGGNFLSFGVFEGYSEDNRMVTFRIEGLSQAEVKELVAQVTEKIVDIRE